MISDAAGCPGGRVCLPNHQQFRSHVKCLTRLGKAVSVPTSSFDASLRIPSTSLPIEPLAVPQFTLQNGCLLPDRRQEGRLPRRKFSSL